MELFTIKLQKDKNLYHANNRGYNTIIFNRPKCFVETFEESKFYNKNNTTVSLFKTKIELNLIDTNHPIFHSELILKIENYLFYENKQKSINLAEFLKMYYPNVDGYISRNGLLSSQLIKEVCIFNPIDNLQYIQELSNIKPIDDVNFFLHYDPDNILRTCIRD